jgi:hypothetical protein
MSDTDTTTPGHALPHQRAAVTAPTTLHHLPPHMQPAHTDSSNTMLVCFFFWQHLAGFSAQLIFFLLDIVTCV